MKDFEKQKYTIMAEAVRFELTEGYKPSTVFKTVALNRSATPPRLERIYYNDFCRLNKYFSDFFYNVLIFIQTIFQAA